MLLKVIYKNIQKIMQSRNLCFLLVSIILASCSSQVQLNRIKHRYGNLPTKVVWLQIPGLSYEQLSILKLLTDDLKSQNEFERFHCIGSISNFSLASARGDSELSFVSQMTGVSSTDECSGYEEAPLWKLVPKKRFSVGVFRDADFKTSKCQKQRSSFYANAVQWRMSQAPVKDLENPALLFHSDEINSFKKDKIYYDRSCSSGKCFSSYSENIKNTLSRFVKNKNFYMYLAHISNYEKVLKKGSIQGIKSELETIAKLISFIKELVMKRYDATLLITSSASLGLELPQKGRDWKKKLSGRQALSFKRTQTQSPVFAFGANAESFCGVFHESDIAKRLLTTP